MDHKSWLWRKKTSEKTIVATDKVDVSVKLINEEVNPEALSILFLDSCFEIFMFMIYESDLRIDFLLARNEWRGGEIE